MFTGHIPGPLRLLRKRAFSTPVTIDTGHIPETPAALKSLSDFAEQSPATAPVL